VAGQTVPCNVSTNSLPFWVELNKETKVVNALKGEPFGFLGFGLRSRTQN
jgi:hypothetical protein